MYFICIIRPGRYSLSDLNQYVFAGLHDQGASFGVGIVKNRTGLFGLLSPQVSQKAFKIPIFQQLDNITILFCPAGNHTA